MTTKRRTTTPKIDCPELENVITLWEQANLKKKSSASLLEKARTLIIEKAKTLREKHCLQEDQYATAIIINNKVKVTFPSQYSQIDGSNYKELEDIIGPNVDFYFKPSVTLEFTDDAMLDPLFLGKLIKWVGGPDKFRKYFKLSRELKPTKEYTIDSLLNARIKRIHESLEKKNIVKQTGIRVSHK